MMRPFGRDFLIWGTVLDLGHDNRPRHLLSMSIPTALLGRGGYCAIMLFGQSVLNSYGWMARLPGSQASGRIRMTMNDDDKRRVKPMDISSNHVIVLILFDFFSPIRINYPTRLVPGNFFNTRIFSQIQIDRWLNPGLKGHWTATLNIYISITLESRNEARK